MNSALFTPRNLAIIVIFGIVAIFLIHKIGKFGIGA